MAERNNCKYFLMGQQASQPTPQPTRVVLVGGGHANVQILKNLSEKFIQSSDNLSLVMISDFPKAYYSGMLPGSISYFYKTEQIQIDLVALCGWCGAEFIEAKMDSVDREKKEVVCSDNLRVKYDILCINIGSETKHTELEGVDQYAITTRPISKLLEKIEAMEILVEGKKDKDDKSRDVIVVGSGAAGLELAWAFKCRFERQGLKPKVCIVHAKATPIFEEEGYYISQNVAKKLNEHKIRVFSAVEGIRAEDGILYLSDGSSINFDYLIWATGAKAPECLSRSGLSLDNGYIKVNHFLQSVDDESIFAVGDCCSFVGRNLAKCGVYSVREGPVAAQNIINLILNMPLVIYQPQTGFLSLLNTSDGEAISSWKGTSFVGGWLMKQKDRIDQNFMNLFNVHILGPRDNNKDHR